MGYNWEVRKVDGNNLEKALEGASANGWEVFTVLTYSTEFVVIVRRPQ